ncbi:hypothetical protein EYF80_023509 [Liparis tanakae]|uniref:Uncharacterized protein n=1 Tax=Liparis tanakae TaxID=230148 RepID=A0A4Z2HLW7_9TELE|nr:hypothetical protein EYF80_023509 [Liparis tanakae]
MHLKAISGLINILQRLQNVGSRPLSITGCDSVLSSDTLSTRINGIPAAACHYSALNHLPSYTNRLLVLLTPTTRGVYDAAR